MGSAKYIGRVGALAVALGIGAGVATTPGIAVAEPSDSTTSSSDSVSSASAASPEPASSSSANTDSASPDTSATANGASSAAESTVAANDSAPPVVVRSSGGAQNSTSARAGQTAATSDSTAAADVESTGEPAEDAIAEGLVEDNVVPETASDETDPIEVVAGEIESSQPQGNNGPHDESVAQAAITATATGEPAGLTETPPAEQPDETIAVEAATTIPDAGTVTVESLGAPPTTIESPLSAVAPQPIPANENTAASPVGVASGMVSSLLAWVGLSPALTTTPVAPVESPALWALLAWTRREFQHASVKQTVVANPVQSSQSITRDLTSIDAVTMGASATAEVTNAAAVSSAAASTNVLGGLLGGLLRLLFNNAPTANYNAAHNVQAPDGVIVGNLNAADPDGDSLTFTIIQAPAHGTVVVNAPDGGFTFTPNPDFAHSGGVDTFTVQIRDNRPSLLSPEGILTVNVSLTVTPVNQAPAAGDPAFTIDEADPATGIVSGSAHVTDPDGDALTYTLTDAPASGTVTVDAATGAWTYTPNLEARLRATDINATPADQQVAFTISASDGDASVPVTVTAPITPLAIMTIDTGSASVRVAISPDGAYAYVANESFAGTVSVIDTATNTIVATIDVGRAPLGVAVSPDGTRVYVANNADDTVSVIDTATNDVVATIGSVVDAARVAVGPDGGYVYVTSTDNDIAWVIDTATNAVVTTIDLTDGDGGTYSVAVSPDGSHAYIGGFDADNLGGVVWVIDTATNTVVTSIDIAAGPYGMVASPDGTRLYVTGGLDNSVSVIDTAMNIVIATIRGPTDPPPEGRFYAGLLAVSPDGRYVYHANNIDGTVSVVDTVSNAVIATIGVSTEPLGMAISPDGTRLYVTDATDMSVSVIMLG